jgi:hypothetical protein
MFTFASKPISDRVVDGKRTADRGKSQRFWISITIGPFDIISRLQPLQPIFEDGKHTSRLMLARQRIPNFAIEPRSKV